MELELQTWQWNIYKNVLQAEKWSEGPLQYNNNSEKAINMLSNK